MAGKGRADYYASGEWNAVCYECGRKRKSSQLKRHWQGYYVCQEHWEPRHPQDFVRNVPDIQTPPWTQPMPADVFVPQTCYPDTSSAIPGYAGPGCMIPARLFDPAVDGVASYCTPESVICRAGQATAGCATIGRV